MSVVLFKVGEEDFGWSEVRTAAEFRGELESLRHSLRDSLIAQTYAEEERFEDDEAVLQEAFNTFRYDRKLLSGPATSAWLNERELSLEDVADFLDRHYWTRRFSDLIPTLLPQYPISRTSIDDLLWPEVVCSRKLTELTLRLAQRLAVEADDPDLTPGTADLDKTRDGLSAARRADTESLDEWLRKNDCDTEWYDRLVALETRYRLKVLQIATPERCAAELQSQRLAITRVEVAGLAFDSLNEAQEAFLSLTMDGETLEEVTALSGAPMHRFCDCLQNLDGDLQDQFISAAEGEVLQTLERQGKFWVFQMLRKADPDPADPKIRSVLEQQILAPYLQSAIQRHVCWQLTLD